MRSLIILCILFKSSFQATCSENNSIPLYNTRVEVDCTDCLKKPNHAFYKTIWFGRMSPFQYHCLTSPQYISKYSLITEQVCNATLCKGIADRFLQRILDRDNISCFEGDQDHVPATDHVTAVNNFNYIQCVRDTLQILLLVIVFTTMYKWRDCILRTVPSGNM